MENMYHWTINFIKICGKNGTILNPEKFEFGVKETDFAGFRVGGGKVMPSLPPALAILKNPDRFPT